MPPDASDFSGRIPALVKILAQWRSWGGGGGGVRGGACASLVVLMDLAIQMLTIGRIHTRASWVGSYGLTDASSVSVYVFLYNLPGEHICSGSLV